MLANSNISAVLAVKDIEVAKAFYEGKLGLEPSGTDPQGIYYKSGNSQVLVYESQFAGTNKATAAGWQVDDIEATLSELSAKGVKFEHYDFPGSTRERDVHVMGSIKAAWFVDPVGNILAIEQM